jgi:hypothetical protein
VVYRKIETWYKYEHGKINKINIIKIIKQSYNKCTAMHKIMRARCGEWR